MSEYKPLVINSKHPISPGGRQWRELVGIGEFSKQIVPKATSEKADINKLSAAVSGMPTIFARANMFRLAMEALGASTEAQGGLLKFYTNLIEEWKGLISCIAINPEKISVERIDLVYDDNKDVSSVDNIYSVAGSFGNALFERKKLWSDLSEAESKPFIDVILYEKKSKKIVVGGTSPDSLFFTSAAYNLSGETAPYIIEDQSFGVTIGKFTNPLSENKIKDFDPNDLKKLWSYVKHLRKNSNKFNEYFHDVLKDLNIDNPGGYHIDLQDCLDSWILEMENEVNSRGIQSQFVEDEVPQISMFHGPFGMIADNSNKLFSDNGVITEEGSGIEFVPNELLLPDTTKIACVCDEENHDYLDNRPLMLLKASVPESPDEIRHFLLPLSAKGIEVFGDTLPSVLGLDDTKSVGSRLTAKYENKDGIPELHVSLNMKTSNGKSLGAAVPVTYKVTRTDIESKDILIWPNFVSKEWNKYYLYSEMPHNGTDWKAIPFCMKLEESGNSIICEENSSEPLSIANGGKISTDDVELLIGYDQKKTNLNGYEYEIFESKNPFKGFKIMQQDSHAGYAVINWESNLISKGLNNFIEDLEEAHVGIDFGSTNSAIAYRIGNDDPVGYQFKNRRLSLFAPEGDDKNNEIFPAVENEVFFFQNDEIKSNEIKSVLSVHDQNRLTNTKNQDFVVLSSELVKGGFPCFEKNLPIENSNKNTHTLNFPGKKSIGNSTLIHNMKWDEDSSTNKVSVARRKAYLKSLILHMYADLFEKKLFPKTLKWAYPSAMGETQRMGYEDVWRQLEYVNPLSDMSKYSIDVKMPKAASIGTTDDDGFDSTNSILGSQVDSDDSFGGDMFDTGGWGDDLSSSTPEPKNEETNIGWGDEETTSSNNESSLDYNTDPVKFKFIKENSNLSMTESSAVARYIMGDKKTVGGISDNKLTMCFDIGGSTTDILVLGVMGGKRSMIKQSSIRFAAQRLAQATKYSSKFFSVIKNFLDKKDLKVEGINSGPNSKFTKETAAYYFEQIVDRLGNKKERDEFYRALANECKELFCVNLYVTGLIIFYAGQLAKKIKLEIDNMSIDVKGRQWLGKPKIELRFTGKGSRIMDWLEAFNKDMSIQYYNAMFINGFGGKDEYDKHLTRTTSLFTPRTEENLQDIKYEVAYGLASPTIEDFYVNDDKDKPLEIIGEDGFVLFTKDGKKISLDSQHFMDPDFIELIGDAFAYMPEPGKPPCPKFSKFAIIFFKITQKFFDLKLTKDDFVEAFSNMNIVDYIKLTPEYRMGRKNLQDGKPFGFVAPIIILEGMKFLEMVLLKKLN